MMQPVFFGVIGGAVVGVLGLLLWAAQRGKPRSDPETETLIFRHSILLRGFAMFAGFGIPIGITILMFFHPPKHEGDVWAIIGLYALFGVLSAPLLWESLGFALVVSPEGLDCQSPWRGRQFILWDEVEDISYSSMNSWFIIRATDGWKFRVSVLVPGLSHFLEQCERHLPLSVLADARPGYLRVGREFPETDDPPWRKVRLPRRDRRD
jgi:hypothetical protein